MNAAEYIPDPSPSYAANACDETLVAAAKNGAHAAYAELCRRHSRMALRTVHRITRNLEDAEDAVQDSLMKGFIHLHNFDGRSAFSSWLTRIAINSALMTLRKRRTRPEHSLDEYPSLESWNTSALTGPARTPEDHYSAQERAEKLRHAVSRLSPTLRTVLEIRQSQEASIEEIADHLGISVAAAKSRLLRARLVLRRSLGPMQKRTPPTSLMRAC